MFRDAEFRGYASAVQRAACNSCKAKTLSVPRCSAAIPSAAARAAESVVMVGMRAITAARRIAFSSKPRLLPVRRVDDQLNALALDESPPRWGGPSFTL
jgi:predicted metal-binding protein